MAVRVKATFIDTIAFNHHCREGDNGEVAPRLVSYRLPGKNRVSCSAGRFSGAGK